MRRALVLGGGGVTGIAWTTGLLYGLEARGVHLRDADRIIGTSAGSTVAAQIVGPTPLAELVRYQREGVVREIPGQLSLSAWLRLAGGLIFRLDKRAGLRRLGHAARRFSDPALSAPRRGVIEQRLPEHDWPDRELLLPAVDVDSGDLRVFDRHSNVALIDAVAASCAVPMVWPIVAIDNHRYMDGGMCSGTNIPLAKDCDRVIVLAPETLGVKRGLRSLDPATRSLAISPDTPSRRAKGRNSLDPTRRSAATDAGIAQAVDVAEAILSVWSG